MNKKPIWKRLKDYKCPNCNADLKKEKAIKHKCTKCTFFISNTKFVQIVKGLYDRKQIEQEDNQNALNNF